MRAAVMNPTDELPPGSVFANQFRVIERIARGGMGTIYRVEQLPTGHPRALKVLQPQAAQDPRARERFTQEAQIAARIESEHVAQVIGAGVDPMTSTPWLALELLQGADLATHLQRKGRLTPPEVAEIMRQLGHALSAAHRLGVIHRDLKPENIFLADARRSDSSLTVKVLDFGVAKWVQEQRQNVASTAVVGSPLWMAPEQLETRGILGPHTDVWAVGLIAFAMLTGRSYWLSGSPDRMSLPDVVNEIAAGPLVPASHRAGELGAAGVLPPGFDAWFARSVHRDGAARYRSVDEQMRELLGVLTPGANLGAASLSGPSAMSSSIPATMALPVQDALRLSGMTPTPATSSTPPVAATMAIPSMATPLQGSAPPFGASSSQQGGHSATMAWMPGQTPVGQPFPGPAPVGPMGPGMASYQGQQPNAMPSWQGPSGGGGGYSPMQYGMPPVPAPGAKSSSGPIIALVLGLGGFLVLGGGALAFVLSRRCESGQHRSEGHCCVDGTDWNSSRGVCEGASIVQTPQFNPPPQQIPPLQQPPLQQPPVLNPPPQNVPPLDPNTPGMTPIPPPPPNNVPTLPPPRPPPPTGTACLGNWSGSLVENTGSRGSMTLTVSSSRGTCARWTETWSSGTRCLYILTSCSPTAGGVRGTGVTLTPRCTGPVNATISCVGDRASFRESVRGTNVVDIGTLARR